MKKTQTNNIQTDNSGQEQFIEALSMELTPVSPHWSAEKRSLFWLITHVFWISLVMYLVQPYRDSLPTGASQIRFGLEVSLFIVSIFMAGYFSFLSIVPGAINTNKLKFMTIPIFLLCLVLLFDLFTSPASILSLGGRSFCEFEILLYSIGPLLHISFLAKKGLFFNSKWTFIGAGLASSLVPASLMHFACAYDYKHILIFHLGTVFLVTAIAATLLKKFSSEK